MARTRDEIEALVEIHTGKTDKDTLMHSLCDNALKAAILKHTFEDTRSTPSDVTTTEADTECDLPTGTRELISVRVIDSAVDANTLLILKPQTWWDKYIINPEDNGQGWPKYGLRFGTELLFDRPVNANITFRFRISTIPTFTSGSTECPIDVLDLFVEYYVTAFVYLSLENTDKYIFWLAMAKSAFKDAVAADERMPAMNQNIENPDSIQPFPGFNTEIGSGFYGDFSSLGNARWF